MSDANIATRTAIEIEVGCSLCFGSEVKKRKGEGEGVRAAKA